MQPGNNLLHFFSLKVFFFWQVPAANQPCKEQTGFFSP